MRGTATGAKLWDKLRRVLKGRVCTDYWRAYEDFIPE